MINNSEILEPDIRTFGRFVDFGSYCFNVEKLCISVQLYPAPQSLHHA